MLIGAGLAGAGIAGYFSWLYLKNKQDKKSAEASTAHTLVQRTSGKKIVAKPSPKTIHTPKQASGTDHFPLKKGSRGSRVKALQQALISRHGKSLLPRYGADGDFGVELESALKKLGLPTQVSETTFHVLTESVAADPSAVAREIFQAVQARSYVKVLPALKKLQSPEDYTAANNVFKTFRIDESVRQSMVTAVLNRFTDADQKLKLKLEFERIGLRYRKDQKKNKWQWSLAGTGLYNLISTKPTWVWKSKKDYVRVPEAMVLGRFAGKEKQFIRFENDHHIYLVRADAVARF